MINNKFFAIDAHCHIYPEKISERAVHGTDNFYGEVSVGTGTVDNLLSLGKAAGIDKFIVQSVATTPKQVQSINNFISEQVSLNPSTLIGLGTLHPDSSDLAADLEHLMSLGLHGVKLHPDIQNFKIDDYRCLKIYELCEKQGLPILVHAGDNRYDNSNPNRLKPVAEIYTNLTIVAAHLGGWSIWQKAAEKLHDLPNVFVDCSSSLPYISTETARAIFDTYGVDKILFGTDYPMWSPADEVRRVLSLDLSDNDYTKIFSQNALHAFKI